MLDEYESVVNQLELDLFNASDDTIEKLRAAIQMQRLYEFLIKENLDA